MPTLDMRYVNGDRARPISARVLALVGVVCALALLAVPAGAAASAHRHRPAPLRGNPARALLAYEAMQKYFFLSKSDLYTETLGVDEASYLWPFSQALAATVSLAHVRTQQSKLAFIEGGQLLGLQHYVAPVSSLGNASSESLRNFPHFAAAVASVGLPSGSFYDDNDWVGIELARIYELGHDAEALALAEQIMGFEQAGWVTDTAQPCRGGLPHESGEGGGFAISAAPAAELAAQLYRITGAASDLQFAQTAYQWVRQCLMLPSGLIEDHIEPDGELQPELWSYNQGAMIGAGALLYQDTGNSGYLEQAYFAAHAATAYFTLEAIASEGEAAPAFASVFLRNLLYLGYVMQNGLGRGLAQEYVNWCWESLRQPSGLFLTADGSPTTLLGQAAIVQVYALLSTPPSTYF